jgi:subtilisin family serine protease
MKTRTKISLISLLVLVVGLTLWAIFSPGKSEKIPDSAGSSAAASAQARSTPSPQMPANPATPPTSQIAHRALNAPPTALMPAGAVATTIRALAASPLLVEVKSESFPAFPEWPGAKILSVRETAHSREGGFRRVSLIQPSDLPYPVRIEEFLMPDAQGQPGVIQRQEMVGNRALAKFDPAMLSSVQAGELVAAAGGRLGRAVNKRGLYIVEFEPGDLDALPRLIAQLSAQENDVVYAEPDFIVRMSTSPNDPRYLDGSLWGLHNTGQNSGTADADIDAPEGWAVRTDASTVVVGVIDTGLALTHEDLAPNLWVNPNETANGADTDNNGFIDDLHGINAIQLNGNPSDDQGHGSHCAGTIGGSGNNGVGITGVAWNVKLMGLKFLSASGGGAVSDAITCIDYGVDNGADILSNSWGGGGYSRALLDSIIAARDAGVIFVVAAGNAATDNDLAPVYPASLPVDNIVAVASTTRTDALSSFSCFGQGSVDIGAPGSEILSVDYENPTGYRSLNGTSMATPHVAGALALLRAQFPSDTWGQLINRLYRGADPIPSLAGGKIANGRRLNLHGALSSTVNRPLNDDFASARVIHGDAIILRTFNHGATAEPGQPPIHGTTAANTVWFSFTSQVNGTTSIRVPAGETLNVAVSGEFITIPYDVIPTVVEVFSGTDLASLTSVGSGTELVSFTAQAGVTYRFAVAGQANAEGLIMLEVVGPPRNATLASALPLTLGTSQSGTNRNALPEPGEPAHAGQPAAASIWYKWTANVTGRVVFTTRGSTFDTLAAVYSGPSTSPTFASLVPVAANDNAAGPGVIFSRAEFNAIAGTTYYIAIDGKAGASGTTYALVIVPPANDHFASPAILSGTDVTRSISTYGASREIGEPIPYPDKGAGESLWFTWTAPETGRTTLDLAGSFFPGIIAVYTGNEINALTLVSKDGAGNRFAQLAFDATQGTTYRILVDAWDWSLSNVPLRLRMVPVPGNDNFASSVELQGVRATAVGSNVGSTRETGEPGNAGPSVWYKWTAPSTGEYGLYGERLNKPDQWIIVLEVFTGSSVNALTSVKEDRANGIGRDAFARFNATAGTTYHFQVTGLIPTGITGGVGPLPPRPPTHRRTRPRQRPLRQRHRTRRLPSIQFPDTKLRRLRRTRRRLPQHLRRLPLPLVEIHRAPRPGRQILRRHHPLRRRHRHHHLPRRRPRQPHPRRPHPGREQRRVRQPKLPRCQLAGRRGPGLLHRGRQLRRRPRPRRLQFPKGPRQYHLCQRQGHPRRRAERDHLQLGLRARNR